MLLVIAVVTVFSYLSLDKIQKIFVEKSYSNLTTSRDMKKEQIKKFFSNKVIEIETLAKSSDIKLLMEELNSSTPNSNFNYKEYLSYYAKKYGYLDIFIVSAKRGKILYRQNKPAKKNYFLANSSSKGDGLYKVWKKTIKLKRVVFIDMISCKGDIDNPSIFMGTPILTKGKLSSVLIFRVSGKELSKIMNFREGYGKTQEDYLVGPDNLMRSDSYLCASTHSLRASFSNPTKGRCDTKATKEGLSGKTAKEIIVDYSGKRVLSAYSPLEINKDLKWAIISEIDESEVLVLPNSIRTTLIIYDTVFLILVLIIILFIVYKMFKFEKIEAIKAKKMNTDLKRMNKKLSKSEYEVILKNEQLEIKVDAVIAKNKQNQTLLFQQSKMAAMGEMIGNIAHQWRQPLNALSALNVRLEMKYQSGKLSKEEMLLFENKSNNLIQGMSSTIDDFRNFFYPNKSTKLFRIDQAIEEAIHFIEIAYKSNSIKLINYTSSKLEITNHRNELIQVLLNIFNNSKDAIKEFNPHNGVVLVDVIESKDRLKITIQDNGGGIKQEVIDRVFEPYFTTKFQDEGTGIGLYMSKMIIEESMGGKLTLENSENGVLTTIEISII